MTNEQRMKNLMPPTGMIDAVLDTDAYNEIDDQFAIAYMLKQKNRINVRAIYAAPFHNEKSESFGDGMNRSYDEILKVLTLMGEEEKKHVVFRGSEAPLIDERTPQPSVAAAHLVDMARTYSPDRPLYVVAIGAITNVASAILSAPDIIENIVVIWLGANGHHYPNNAEFNLLGDIAAARVVMGCGVPFVLLPCMGVVSAFTTSEHELRYWLEGKNELCDYLVENTVAAAEIYAKGRPWTRVIWDVCAVAWLSDNIHLLASDIRDMKLPTYDKSYEDITDAHKFRYVYHINRDALFCDLVDKLTK